MSDRILRLLIVGGELPALAPVLPLLRRIEFEVERADDGATAVARLDNEQFDLLIVGHPLPAGSLHELVDRARAVGAPSRQAGLLVISAPHAAGEARGLLGRGVNRVVGADEGAEEVLFAVADLLGTAPRTGVRAVVQLEVKVGRDRSFGLYQTSNVSGVGMLVRSSDIVPVGAQCAFELSLPGLDGPIRGAGEIVRRTDPRREGVEGFAVRFVSFEADGGDRLRALAAGREL